MVFDLWPFVVALVVPAVQATAAVHLLLRKRDVRSTVGWMGLIWLVPVVGTLLYILLGINRIKRKAQALRPEPAGYGGWIQSTPAGAEEVAEHLGPSGWHLAEHVVLGDRVTNRPLLAGNAVVALVNGDQAYPAMLEAIDEAQRSVTLLTYIFDHDEVGRKFLNALRRAVQRGVAVRILIDDVGAHYSGVPMARALKRVNVPVARFMPTVLPWRISYLNLRNHRKILVTDGRRAFTGGMNIRDEFWHGADPDHFARDLHFRIEGPVVGEIQEVFAEDWTFTTGERLEGDRWFPSLEPIGDVLARGISDGPDIDYEKLETMLLGALGVARRTVRIVTPYFLPDRVLVTALNLAAQRGVEVDVLIPDKGNLALVQWASMAQLEHVVEKGVRVFVSPPPFDHSKLMVVDGQWVLLGSANWDPRSLQLNFEFNVECYDRELGSLMDALIEARLGHARNMELADLRARPLPVKLRDGVARLFSPYL